MNAAELPVNGPPLNATKHELIAEIDRLRASLDDAQRRIADLQAERDQYYQIARAWAGEQCKEEDWVNFNPDEYTIPMEDLIADAEAMLKRRG